MGVGAIHGALTTADSFLPGAALSDWKRLLSQATGHDLDRPSAALDGLGPAYGIEAEDGSAKRPAEIAFALHTYYSLLVKLILQQAMESSSKPAELARTSADDLLLRKMRAMDDVPLSRALWHGHPGCVVLPSRAGCPCHNIDPFGWYVDAWCGPLAQWIRKAAGVIGRYDPRELRLCGQEQAGGVDLLGDLYQGLLPKNVRHALGEYYTPSWLVSHILDGLDYRGEIDGQFGGRLLDPACGSGNFLLAAIRRIRRSVECGWSNMSSSVLARKITASVVGFDLNPTAVLAARANYLLAISDLIAAGDPPRIPVYLRDTILDDSDLQGRFDYVAGNPPWIAWDNLADEYREKTKPLWQHYGLFTLSATAARHGGGKKDLSMLMTYVCADRHLRDGGRLGFVVTQTVFQTKGAGDGFRRFQLGHEGPHLRVLHADDMVRIRPFPGTANWTGTLFLQKGSKTEYPIAYDRWRLLKGRHMPDSHSPDDGAWRERFERERLVARPIDHQRASSPWFVQPAELETDLTRLIGPSEYTAHLGANTGGANPVYWVQIVKDSAEAGNACVLVRNLSGSGGRDRTFDAVEEWIEPDLLYPLVRWGNVRRFAAVPAAHIILAQNVDTRRGHDEQWLRSQCPKTLAYLQRFRRQLEARAAYKRYQSAAAFYSMYNVGRYTLAAIKVVWRRMDKRINAAVLEPLDDEFLGTRPVVPQETCVIVEVETADEGHYLAAVLNSRRTDFIVGGHSVSGGKGFGTPSMLDYLRIVRYDPQDERHAELARLSRLAHQQAAGGGDTSQTEAEIDAVNERL